MEKEKYFGCELEMFKFRAEDVITTSASYEDDETELIFKQ